MVKKSMVFGAIILALVSSSAAFADQPQQTASTFVIPDTGQDTCYDVESTQISCPAIGAGLFGQDGSYHGTSPAYQDNGDGTITDLVTGLMWQKTPLSKVTWDQAMADASSVNVAGYNDWRVPTIKELYSLMNFNGVTGRDVSSSTPYLDTTYFDFSYGDTGAGERVIDAQYWSSTLYSSTTLNGVKTGFGVNFADGRIKGYPIMPPQAPGGFSAFVRYVRGTSSYGINQFVDNGDETVTDQASGLMWMQDDSGSFNAGSQGDGSVNWEEALDFCEDLNVAGWTEWRLPNAKELQSLVDYSRSPDTTASAAIDPIFNTTQITNEGGQADFPAFWTSTTHHDGPNFAVYVAFGRALGYMELPPNSGTPQLMDVHGAGAQRSDPKSGDPSQYAGGHGPQGDVVRIYNYARCVRGGSFQIFTGGDVTAAANIQQQFPADGQTPQGQGQPPQGEGQPPQGQPPMGGQPPQEAIDACNGLTEGATCTINTPQGALQGTCQNISTAFACVPPR